MGRLHVIFFEDVQPFIVVHNKLDIHIQVGIALPTMANNGSVEYKEPRRCIIVEPDTSCQGQLDDDLTAGSGRPSARTAHETATSGVAAQSGGQPLSSAELEEEEAFLQLVTGQQEALPLGRKHAPLVQLRLPSAAGWSASCALLDGSSSHAGSLSVEVWREAATFHVECHDSSQHPSRAARLEALQPIPQPLNVSVALECLQLCLWDDERRHLLGRAQEMVKPVSAAADMPGQDGAREVLCISLDGLTIYLARHTADALSRRQMTELRVEAQGMQCDAHMPGSSQPVFCRTELQDSRRPAMPDSLDPPFLLNLQVLREMSGGYNGIPLSLKSTWVPQLRFQVPVLAIAVDDSLVQFLERASARFASSAVTAATSTASPAESIDGHDPGQTGDVVGTVAVPQLVLAGDHDLANEWQRTALVEAHVASAPRLLIEQFDIGPLRFLIDVHVTGHSRRIPFAIDTQRAPVVLSALCAEHVLFRPGVMVQALLTHYTAEALLNAPRVLGSLQLLLNPTGLLYSISAGLLDLVGLPAAALMAGSPSQFVASLGRGPASLLWHISGWTLTSISGFSNAASHVLQQSLLDRQQDMARDTGDAASEEVLGEERQSSRPGSLVAGVSRGLLGAVGVPLTSALDLVSGVTSSIAATTGVAPRSIVRHAARSAGEEDSRPTSAMCMRLLSAIDAGLYQMHCRAAEATLFEESGGVMLGALALSRPLLVLTSSALVVLTPSASGVVAVLHLKGAKLRLNDTQRQLHLNAASSYCASLPSGSFSTQLRLQATINVGMWFAICAGLRASIQL